MLWFLNMLLSWKWSNRKPLNGAWHLVWSTGSCFLVLFWQNSPNDSIQSHLQTCLVLIPQKVALQRDPFWRGEHKTRNVIPSQQKKWKAKRVASFSVRTLATVFLLHTPDDPLTWCLLLEQLVCLSSTSHAFNPKAFQQSNVGGS